MADYQSNIDLAAAARLLCSHQRVLVTTHAKPDGDAFGAVLALGEALREINHEVHLWVAPPVPAQFEELRGADGVQRYSADATMPEVDMVVVVDTGAWAQLSPMRNYLEPRADRTLIIDHHLSGDLPAKWKYIDSTSAATCEIIAQLVDELARQEHQIANRMLDPIVSDALFVGIASDTGWFRFSNTRPFTHELAARLIRQGVDHAALYAQLEQGERPEKLQLQIRALQSMRLLANNTIAMMVLRAEDFEATGTQVEETERFVDIPQMVASVLVVVLVTEPPDEADGKGATAPPLIRMSFRSKPGKGAVNVAELAAQFGGGGHARAAGAKVPGPLDVVVSRVAAALDAVAAK